MKKNILMITILILNFSCSRLQTLNLKPHSFSSKPSAIVWLQLAGFSEHHLALLKNTQSQNIYISSFEKSLCVGKSWNYSLTSLRPDAPSAFNSQVLGIKNTKLSCDDFSEKSIWNTFEKEGYQSTVIEVGQNINSLENLKNCDKGNNPNVKFIFMKPPTPLFKNLLGSFHFQDFSKSNFIDNNFAYDKTCSETGCLSTVSENLKALFSTNLEINEKFILIRDFRYLNAIKKKQFEEMKNILIEYNSLLEQILEKKSNTLFIITSAESTAIDLPLEGKEWRDFELKGAGLNPRFTQLMSPVMVFGPRSENFCGIYEDSEIKKRIFFLTDQKIFNWNILNPFN